MTTLLLKIGTVILIIHLEQIRESPHLLLNTREIMSVLKLYVISEIYTLIGLYNTFIFISIHVVYSLNEMVLLKISDTVDAIVISLLRT